MPGAVQLLVPMNAPSPMRVWPESETPGAMLAKSPTTESWPTPARALMITNLPISVPTETTASTAMYVPWRNSVVGETWAEGSINAGKSCPRRRR